MDVKDIILATSIAKGSGGGSGGGVTKEYVDTQVGAVSERVDDVEDVIPSAATPQNPLATVADVSETVITSTSATSPITDSSNGMVQGLTVYGKSEVVDGEIKSVGDDGLTVTTANSDNTLTTSAEFTTALPLRSTLDEATRDELIIGKGKAEVITRCEVVDDSIVPLATPITTPLTSAEISAFRGLRTYDNTTNVTITDEPEFELDYLKNTDNGQAVADIQTDLQGQIDGLKIKTLTYTGTGSSTNTITFPEIPVCIFSFANKQRDSFGNFNWTNPFTWNSPYITIYYTGSSSGSRSTAVSYTDNTMTLKGGDAGLAMNRSDTEYNIYYI